MNDIPDSIKEIFERLKNEVVRLHAIWMIYRQLFEESDKRRDLLKTCAPVFFDIIRDALINETQISLTRLTDPDVKGKNLSFRKLQVWIQKNGNRELASTASEILDRLDAKLKPIRVRRNKRLAHLDFDTAMKKRTQPLPGVSRKMIEDALRLVGQYMNTVEKHYYQATLSYDQLTTKGMSDGNALVSTLKHGFRYIELVIDGKISLEDQSEGGKWHDA